MRKNRKLVSATLATLAAFTTAFAEPTGCPDFEVELPRATKGPVVKATDFGLSEANENNIGAITAALAEAKRIGASRVELAPGTYRCFERTKGERGIIIEGFTDFTFDGKGATLVFRRDHAPLEHQADQLYDAGNVEVQNCQRTLVENFNMDWDWEKAPLASWVKCVGKHEDEAEGASYADFEFDRPHPDYPGHVPVKLLTAMSADRCGGRMDDSFGEPGYFGSSLGHIGTKSEWLSPTRLRVWPFVKPDYGYFAKEAEARYRPGRNREFTKKIDVGGTFALSHSYYGLNGFVFTSNRHFTLRNVDLWACKGFAVEVRGSQKYWQLVNFNIRQKPGEKRPCTSAADAYHVAQSLGYGKMVGCEISMHVDDHFNYHDRTQIAMKRGARTVEVVNNRGVAYTLFRKGSRIRLREESFADTGWVGSIVNIEGERITFDRDLPEPKGMLFVLMDADFATENFLVKDCRFHHNPWSRGLFNGSNATFDGCTFGPMVGRPIFLLSCYTYNVWCEGIGCTNIVVRNCRFENCLDIRKERGPCTQIMSEIAIPPSYDPEPFPLSNADLAAKVAENRKSGRAVKPSDDALGDILVENCTFVNPRGNLMAVRNGRDVTFRGNKVVWDNPPCPPLPYAGKVRVEGGRNIAAPAEFLSSDGSPAERLKAKLLAVGASPNYYWAWTYQWIDHHNRSGDVRNVVERDGAFFPRPPSEVKPARDYLKYSGGRQAFLNYADLAMVVGTWHSDRYYAVNRAALTAAAKKLWAESGAVMVFNWHMDHPYCTNGFPQASYRFRDELVNTNVVRQILDGTGGPCGTGDIDGRTTRAPFANPREWYMASLRDVADFFNGLVDDKTGEKIPVVLRLPHEMDGAWFWWGRTSCTTEEFRRLCRMEADYMRKACPGQILYAYTPDKTWKDFGREGDVDNTFLAYYPGDEYVDIIGIDDYSIGHGDDARVERSLAETVRKLRLLTSFAEPRGQVVCISEAGGQKKRSDFWSYLHRAATAEGVRCAFVDTWSSAWGTEPESPEEAENQKAFVVNPAVLMAEGRREKEL